MIILWFLAFSIFIGFFSKRDILTCGIWAWSGSSPALFNADKFNILGMFNDSRGGDASGKFMDRHLYKGIDKHSDFKNLITKYPTIEVKENTVAVGHARKASVGGKTIENAQPFFIYKDDNCLGVFLHNGTITNIRTLCEKYNVEYNNNLSDSYHLGYLLFTVGNQILSEYIGSAACMWIKWNNRNRLYAFKGESKFNQWAQVMTEDRPLYIYKEITKKGTSYWLSSMSESLNSAFQITDNDAEQVMTLRANSIYLIDKDKLSIVKNIDRSKTFETVTYPIAKTKQIDWSNPKTWLEENMAEIDDKIIFHKGRYHLNGKLANGVITVDTSGYLNDKGYKLYFVYGVLMRDKKNYLMAISTIPTYPIIDFNKKILDYTDQVVSDYPGEVTNPNGWARVYEKPMGYATVNHFSFFSGTFKPLFSSKYYIFSNGGDLKTVGYGNYNYYIPTKNSETIPKDTTEDDKLKEWSEEICENLVDEALTKIKNCIKEIKETFPENEELTKNYIGTLESMEEAAYDELTSQYYNTVGK